MWTYEPFRIWFYTKHPTKKKGDLPKETKLSRHTITKIWKDKHVMTSVVERLCETYKLPVEQVCRWEEETNEK